MFKHTFRNLNFQRKIFTVCLLVSLIPLILLGSICHQKMRSILIDRERTNLSETLIQESKNLNDRLDKYENVMNGIVWNNNVKLTLSENFNNSIDMHTFDQNTLAPLISTQMILNPDIESIILYTNITQHSIGNRLRSLDELKNMAWYEEVCSDYKQHWIISEAEETLSLACQFYDLPKDYTSIAIINLDYTSVFSSLEYLYEQSYGILLTDRHDTPLFEFRTADIEENTENLPLLISGTDKEMSPKYIIETTSGIGNNWTIYLYRPINTITSATRSIIILMVSIIILSLLCVILVSSLLSKSIVLPLKYLTENMHQIEMGKLQDTITYESSDEIGYLIKSFKRMVHQLNYLVNEVLNAKVLQKEYEMRALQAQINPHFLYNSLSLINSKAILSDQVEISQMAQFLSSFYRTTLNKGKHITTIKDEFENVSSYINIQLLLHSNSFDVEYHIDENILSYNMPNLLLQPLVENAIMHGIDHIEKPERGLLKIAGYCKDDTLFFQITDNGPGIPEDKLKNILSANTEEGYGVSNVLQRIQLTYGSEYGLSYQCPPGQGTIVTLTISTLLPAI